MKPHALVALAIVLATVFLMIGASSDVDINMLRGCTDTQVAKWDATNYIWDCANDNAGGGSAVTFDIGDDGGDDSTDISEIATTGDTNSIFTESSPDKVLIAVGNNWPTADTATTASALAGDPANCAGTEAAGGVTAAGVGEACLDPITETELSDESELEAQLSDVSDVYTNNDGDPIYETELDSEAELEAQIADASDVFTDNDVDVVDADALKDTDSPGDEECLTYESTGSTMEWQACGGAGANSFETHDVPSGTDPVASSSSDTLTWTVTGSEITLTGDSGTDTIDIDFAADAGTDITADLEEETHASEHAESGADELNLEDLDTDCASDQFLRESSGGVACYTMVAAAISDLHANTDITADLEEEAHCAEHDGRSTTCSTEVLNADAELYTDTKCVWFEDPTADDDFKSLWTANIAGTITGISCESDQTVDFDLQIDDGSPADINGSDITCTSWAEDTTLGGDTSMGANEHMDLAITSVTDTPTWVSICWEFTYDD